MHPQHFTLRLFRAMLDTMPPGVRDRDVARMLTQLKTLEKNHNAGQDMIDRAVRKAGQFLYPYRRAFEELYARHGALAEARAMRNHLSSALAAKYENFLRDGGNLEAYQRGRALHEFFDADERFALGSAARAAREDAEHSVRDRIRQSGDEYAALIGEYTAEYGMLRDKLNALWGLANRSQLWKDEISSRAMLFEDSIAGLERLCSKADLEAALHYYYDAITLAAEPVRTGRNDDL